MILGQFLVRVVRVFYPAGPGPGPPKYPDQIGQNPDPDPDRKNAVRVGPAGPGPESGSAV